MEEIQDRIGQVESLINDLDEELDDPEGDITRAQGIAARIHELLIEEQADGMTPSSALQDELRALLEETEADTDAEMERLLDQSTAPRNLPAEWSEGGLHLHDLPAKLSRELREVHGLYRITVEPSDQEGHHYNMRFEDISSIFPSRGDQIGSNAGVDHE